MSPGRAHGRPAALCAAGKSGRRVFGVERMRANPSVETVIRTGTASEGSANLSVIVTSRAAGGDLWIGPEGPPKPALLADLLGLGQGSGPRENRESTAGLGFCRVPQPVQQAINGYICDD